MQKGLQRIKRILFIILALAAAFVMPACEEEAGEVPETVAVSVADSIFFTSSVPPALVPLGGDYTFTLNMLHSCEFISCDYDDYSVRMIRPGVFELTLHNVVAPARVSVTAQLAERESEHTELDCSITYELLGATYEGAGSRTVDYVVTQHLRPNTWNGQGLEREGFTLLGWNTEEDGSGEHIGLGSRVTVEDGGHITLYAEWVEWLPADDFLYRENADGTAALTGYRGPGDDELFVMPAQLDGHEITSVANSFTTNIPCGNITSPVLVLPDTVISIASGAFMHSAFEEMYFFDTLEDISLTAFSNNIKTYHLNAALPPHYQALNNSSYYADSVDKAVRDVPLDGRIKQENLQKELVRDQIF